MQHFSHIFPAHSVHRAVSSILLIIGLLILAACQTSDAEEFEDGPLTLLPAPTLIDEGSCDQTVTLESWLQLVTFQRRDFIRLMNEASGQTPIDLRDDVEQLALHRDRIAQEPVPDCGLDMIPALIAAMDGVLAEFVDYINGEDVDLGAVVESFADDFAAVDAQMDALLTRLENQFQTPAAP